MNPNRMEYWYRLGAPAFLAGRQGVGGMEYWVRGGGLSGSVVPSVRHPRTFAIVFG